jgi:hypothetical protein
MRLGVWGVQKTNKTYNFLQKRTRRCLCGGTRQVPLVFFFFFLSAVYTALKMKLK